jgi:hypothetical protein
MKVFFLWKLGASLVDLLFKIAIIDGSRGQKSNRMPLIFSILDIENWIL